MTPIEFASVARTHFFRYIFSSTLRELKLELNESSVEGNVKLFKQALKKSEYKQVLIDLEKAEKEPELIKVLFAPEPIEEGEEYAFMKDGQKMGGTITTCDCCGGYCFTNGYQVDKFPRGVLPAKKLEDIPEMSGYSEERDQAECEICDANGGKKPKEKG